MGAWERGGAATVESGEGAQGGLGKRRAGGRSRPQRGADPDPRAGRHGRRRREARRADGRSAAAGVSPATQWTCVARAARRGGLKVVRILCVVVGRPVPGRPLGRVATAGPAPDSCGSATRQRAAGLAAHRWACVLGLVPANWAAMHYCCFTRYCNRVQPVSQLSRRT